MQAMIEGEGRSEGKPEVKAEVAPFLRNLRKMLDVESDEVLRWTPDGRAFEIHDMERMMESVLPKYFKHRKYTSFQRQLNYFSFKKWTKSKAVVCTFSNEHFVRDRPELAWRITRKKSAPSGSPKASAAAAAAAAAAASKARARAAAGRSPSPPPLAPSWKHEDVALRVPLAKRTGAAGDFAGLATARSFPSPTDVDAMFTDHDGAAPPPPPPLRYYSPPASMALASPTLLPPPSAATAAPGLAADADPLEWIDSFLPPLDASARLSEDQVPLPLQPPSGPGPYAYMGSMMALLRPSPSPFGFPAPSAPPTDSYMCLATM